jgi:hypothetical protein
MLAGLNALSVLTVVITEVESFTSVLVLEPPPQLAIVAIANTKSDTKYLFLMMFLGEVLRESKVPGLYVIQLIE